MVEVPVYNTSGEKVDTLSVDENAFGGRVNAPLLKQAIVRYQANRRQGSAVTRGRADVAGSTKKLFRQKGTGNARRGNIRTGLLRGGGVTFAKTRRDFGRSMPKKMRRAALNSAILAKLVGGDLMVLNGLSMDAPKTRTLADLVASLEIDRTCLLVLPEADRNVYLSSRNIRDLKVLPVGELNAYDVAIRRKMIVTDEAMAALTRAREEVQA